MTRKIFALALAALPALAGARDLKAGSFEVGAGTNLNLSGVTTDLNDTELVKMSTTAFNGNALYYVANDFGLGLDLAYDKTKTELGATLGGGSSTTTQWTFGPIAKVNLPVSPSVSVVLLGEIGLMKVEEEGFSADGWALNVGGGIRYFPADFVSLDALLSYAYASASDDASNDYTVKGWNLGAGFSFYFGGK